MNFYHFFQIIKSPKKLYSHFNPYFSKKFEICLTYKLYYGTLEMLQFSQKNLNILLDPKFSKYHLKLNK